MIKSLVTGSSGFLGSEIIKRLVEKGGKVIAFDILPSEKKMEGVVYIQGDLLDKDKLFNAMKGVDYVFHSAALVPLTKAGKGFHEVNVIGTRNVVECVKKLLVKKLIHISSSAIYGIPSDMPVTSSTVPKPVEIYGKSKLEAEKEVWRYMKEGGGASCIRPRTIIGGKGRLGIFQVLFEWISENRNIYIMGDGSNSIQFVHIDDLVDACLLAADSQYNGLYNIGTDRFQTLRKDLEALIAHVGSSSRVVGLPAAPAQFILHLLDILRLSPLSPWHYMTYHKSFVCDISKAKNELGWSPRYSNLEALIDTYKWYIDNIKNFGEKTEMSAHKKPLKQKLLRIIKWLS